METHWGHRGDSTQNNDGGCCYAHCTDHGSLRGSRDTARQTLAAGAANRAARTGTGNMQASCPDVLWLSIMHLHTCRGKGYVTVLLWITTHVFLVTDTENKQKTKKPSFLTS